MKLRARQCEIRMCSLEIRIGFFIIIAVKQLIERHWSTWILPSSPHFLSGSQVSILRRK